MKMTSRLIEMCALTAALAASLALPRICRAQGTDPNFVTGQEQQQETNRELKERTMSDQKGSQAPKVDPKESKAYKAFYDANPQDPDTRIKLGEDFVKQYPSGPYTESVYTGLVQAYYVKQDWDNFYASADKALAIKPDEVDVLITVGWVIPHIYNPSDPDASKKLDKAEAYETMAIQILANLPKPANLTDEQFAALKTDKSSEAHSGLGLVYFRRQDFDKAAKELELAVQGTSHPDPTDYFALGAALQNTQQYSKAADAYDHCAQIPGSLQSNCKEKADAARKTATQGK
jgi:tetratricopeptide (TPR) repeat protein